MSFIVNIGNALVQYSIRNREMCIVLQILMSVPRILVLVMKMQTVPIVTVLIAVLVSKASLAMTQFVTVWEDVLNKIFNFTSSQQWYVYVTIQGNCTETYELTICFVISSDVDECSAELRPCDENADCANRDGFYSCTCKRGYTGNGTVCEGNKGDPGFQSKYTPVS